VYRLDCGLLQYANQQETVAKAAVDAVPAHITMEQAVTMTATATVMENVKSNNQLAATADTPSELPTLRHSPAAVTVA